MLSSRSPIRWNLKATAKKEKTTRINKIFRVILLLVCKPSIIKKSFNGENDMVIGLKIHFTTNNFC